MVWIYDSDFQPGYRGTLGCHKGVPGVRQSFQFNDLKFHITISGCQKLSTNCTKGAVNQKKGWEALI